MCLFHQLTILLILLVLYMRIQLSAKNHLPPPPPPAILHQLPLPPLAPVPIQNGRLVRPQMPPLAPKSTLMMPPAYKPRKLPLPPTALPLPFNMLAMAPPKMLPLASQTTPLPPPLPTPPMAPSPPPAPPTVKTSVITLTETTVRNQKKPISSNFANSGHGNGRIPWWQILLALMLLIAV